MKIYPLFCFAAFVTPVSAVAQDFSPEAVAVTEETQAEADAAVSEFLSVKRRGQRNIDQSLAKENATTDVAQLRQILRNAGVQRPRPFLNMSAAAAGELQESLLIDAAQLLGNLELRPARSRQLQKGGVDPFTASVDFIRGAADYDDLAILSDTVVIGRVLQVDEATLGDGYGSTIQFEVEEAIAGNVPQRTRLQIRQVGSKSSPSQGHISEAGPSRVLLFLSRGWYKNQSLTLNGTPAINRNNRGRYFASITAPFAENESGSFVPTALSTLPPVNADQLRSRFAPLVRFRTQNNLEASAGVEEQ